MIIARVDKFQLTPLVTLPSGGDTSYSAFVWHEGLLWTSYYSSHEGKTAIYLADKYDDYYDDQQPRLSKELVVAGAGHRELALDPALLVEHGREHDAAHLGHPVRHHRVQPVLGARAGDQQPAGEIDDRAKLIVMTPERFWSRSRIHAHVNHEVLSIDRAAKTIRVKSADGTEHDEPYDRLILSQGAKPIVPPIPGADKKGVFVYRTIEDLEAITAAAQPAAGVRSELADDQAGPLAFAALHRHSGAGTGCQDGRARVVGAGGHGEHLRTLAAAQIGHERGTQKAREPSQS